MKMIFLIILILLNAHLLIGSEIKNKFLEGGKVFVKKCKHCHDRRHKLGKKYTKQQWNEYFNNEAQLIKDRHPEHEVKDLFKKKRFLKRLPYLKMYIIEYAKDSGIPSETN